MKAIILAGGGGTRLWPLSRQHSPKQVEPVIGNQSLLQATYARLRHSFAARDIVVAVGAAQADAVRRQLKNLPNNRLFVEPCRRDTASAIGYALTRLSLEDPTDTFVIINSDAFVRDEREYLRVIKVAGNVAASSEATAVLIGLRPEYPETGYGYIRRGRSVKVKATALGLHDRVFSVGRFVEKPDAMTARRYVRSGEYYWNPTLVVGRVDRFLELYRRHLPRHAAIFERMRPALMKKSELPIRRLFATLPAISLDYGILEKAAGLLLLPASFGWIDVGSWRAVKEILAPDIEADAVKGEQVSVDSSGNLIFSGSGRLVAVAGVQGMAIVDMPDAVLVCPLEHSQKVKRIVGRLAANRRLKRYL